MLPLTLLALTTASAGRVEVPIDGRYQSGAPVHGAGGWESGWAEDPWMGVQISGRAWARPTRGEASGAFLGGGSASNSLLQTGVSLGQGQIDVLAYTEARHTVGVLFNVTAAAGYGLLLVGPEGADAAAVLSPLDTGHTGAHLIRWDEAGLEVLAHADWGYPTEQTLKIAVGNNDGNVWARVWARSDDAWDDHAVLLQAADPAPLGPGALGFYSYGMGGAASPTQLGFPLVWALDDDDDGVIDDEDNCEKVANASQADGDGDGVGAACDEDELGGGDGTDGTDGTVSEDTGEPVEDSGGSEPEVEPEEEVNQSAEGLSEGAAPKDEAVRSCAAAPGSPASGGIVGLVAVLGVAVRKRRRR